jgi:hypothetical protein
MFLAVDGPEFKVKLKKFIFNKFHFLIISSVLSVEASSIIIISNGFLKSCLYNEFMHLLINADELYTGITTEIL